MSRWEADVGIVGFGRCGRLAAETLYPTCRVTVTDVRDLSRDAEALGVGWSDLAGVASRPWVLLAVPIRALPLVLDGVAPHLRGDALLVDTASVKVRPMEWMAERLPAGAAFAGTHPLFGPDSVREAGLAGQRIAVCAAPGREEAADEVAAFARRLGLEPVRVEPEAHDRDMARSQALAFLIARALKRAGIGPPELTTPSERRVFAALALTDADSSELYEDILALNPFAAEAAGSLEAALRAEIARASGGPGTSL
ncbi:MAG TPA: prephenate dehydrogenase/arogenate dehydrogenase family protein [Gemmatimonadota bacterium]|nr:prephenate dehydrogenase/arogenate dehydrogenase family protein [Gemmatimonadota bacterium]